MNRAQEILSLTQKKNINEKVQSLKLSAYKTKHGNEISTHSSIAAGAGKLIAVATDFKVNDELFFVMNNNFDLPKAVKAIQKVEKEASSPEEEIEGLEGVKDNM